MLMLFFSVASFSRFFRLLESKRNLFLGKGIDQPEYADIKDRGLLGKFINQNLGFVNIHNMEGQRYGSLGLRPTIQGSWFDFDPARKYRALPGSFRNANLCQVSHNHGFCQLADMGFLDRAVSIDEE